MQLKLIKALEKFKIDVNDKICIDLGSSTGGFTDVLINKNAKKFMQLMLEQINFMKNLKKIIRLLV